MSDDVTVEDQQESAGGLRKQLEAALERERTLRNHILTQSYEQLGLDPSQGLGKAIAKEYSGEASYDALASYAESEYGYVAPQPEPETLPIVTEVAEKQMKLDELQNTSGSIAEPAPIERIAAAEQEGDYLTAMRLKNQQLQNMLKAK